MAGTMLIDFQSNGLALNRKKADLMKKKLSIIERLFWLCEKGALSLL